MSISFTLTYKLILIQLRETDEELGRSGRVLNRMITRVMQNRLILLGLVLLIFFVIIIAVYFGVRKNH